MTKGGKMINKFDINTYSIYVVDWEKQSIIHRGFDEDERGFNIIDWLFDLTRRLNQVGQKINTIACNVCTRKALLHIYTEWNISHVGYKKNKRYTVEEYEKFYNQCVIANAISVDGEWLRFEIIEDDDIYLKTLKYDKPVKEVERKPITLEYYLSFLTKLIKKDDVSVFFDEG